MTEMLPADVEWVAGGAPVEVVALVADVVAAGRNLSEDGAPVTTGPRRLEAAPGAPGGAEQEELPVRELRSRLEHCAHGAPVAPNLQHGLDAEKPVRRCPFEHR